MTLWTEKARAVAEAKLGDVYAQKWWSPEFAESHPKVTFLMQVLNRHVISPSEEYVEDLRKQVAELDEGADYALGRRPVYMTHVKMAKIAFTALMLEERARSLRFAMSAVMTDEDNRDLVLLLNDVDEDRSTDSSSTRNHGWLDRLTTL